MSTIYPVHEFSDHVIYSYYTATASHLKTTSDDDDDEREKAWQWAGIGATIGLCMGFATGISFMFAWTRWLKLCRGNLVKSSRDDALSSKGAHGSGDTGHGKRSAAANYTAIKNELPMSSEYREYLNSSAVNESFELSGINRTESFHSLSCYDNKDD